MRQAGEVTYADAHKERTNEGVIEFRSHSDMKRALDKLDGTDINGRKIRLVEDRPRRRRSYSGSRSRWEHYNASDWMLCEKSILNSDFNCIANKLAALMQFLTLLSSDLVVAVAPAAGAAGATEAGAPGVVPDPTPGENGSNLHQKYRSVFQLKYCYRKVDDRGYILVSVPVNNLICCETNHQRFFCFTDLVPAATKDVVIPAPDLEGSLAPSQEKASRALATAGPVLDPANPSLVHTRANPAPVQPTINPSPAQRAAQR